jgi:UDP-N-acetylglucosamine diphosphorylase / glucose-1-phosphate thymidylyltransferase / UDP-N-acetylgalactosamine diphosphorylase / glucosamine-1-phosphate N-acetyltransferase / galactosamine-1-phosphate N-acetyltransferase
MQQVILFDDGLSELSPLTDLRAAFDLRTGALTTLERWRRTPNRRVVALFCPKGIEAVTRERHAIAVNKPPSGDEPLLLVNARCPRPPRELESLGMGQALIERASGDVVAAFLDADSAREFLATRTLGTRPTVAVHERCLISRPWHVRTFRDACLAMDLALLESPRRGDCEGVNVFGSHSLTIAPTARVYPGATFDLEQGPIVIDEHAIVRPGAILIGPCYVGEHSSVLERATIRPNTAIGPWCKVNGEVGGTIFQGFSNKAHDGYLGDSWVGEWVNLGAGTTNSNLLNTYAQVIARATPASSNERTGEQFLGATIGDHVKTAICTRLMTGCVLGTGGMFATTAPVSGATPRFAWATDTGTRAYRLDKFLEVLHAAMARRTITPGEAYLARVAALHAMGGA